ncbi:tyrosine-type recombinase/integrase [candidate division WWE3 bacterium]|nr:tyrosine-type recombinase/integrase [candidate division WWE3 bacterium]
MIETASALDLKTLIARYLEFCEVDRNLSQYTIKMYHFYLNDFLVWVQSELGSDRILVSDVDVEVVRKYRLFLNRRISSKSHEEFKKSTQKTFLVALRAFLKYLIRERGLDVLPPDRVALGKPEARVPKVLTDEQLRQLFSAQNLNKRSGLRDRAILELLFSTGLRVSELVNLNIDDVNLNTDEFSVVGKGRKVRVVYLSDDAKRWLGKYLATRNDEFKPLFLRYSGRRMRERDYDGESLRLTPRSVQRLVKKYSARVGISVDTTPHTLRHSFATGLLREGADLRSVQELLGHSSVSTTQIYTHVTNRQLKDAHKKFHRHPRDFPAAEV